MRQQISALDALKADLVVSRRRPTDLPSPEKAQGLSILAGHIEEEQERGRIGSDFPAISLARALLAGVFHYSYLTQLVGEDQVEPGFSRWMEEFIDITFAAARSRET